MELYYVHKKYGAGETNMSAKVKYWVDECITKPLPCSLKDIGLVKIAKVHYHVYKLWVWSGEYSKTTLQCPKNEMGFMNTEKEHYHVTE